jgi:hypothetical protein
MFRIAGVVQFAFYRVYARDEAAQAQEAERTLADGGLTAIHGNGRADDKLRVKRVDRSTGDRRDVRHGSDIGGRGRGAHPARTREQKQAVKLWTGTYRVKSPAEPVHRPSPPTNFSTYFPPFK